MLKPLITIENGYRTGFEGFKGALDPQNHRVRGVMGCRSVIGSAASTPTACLWGLPGRHLGVEGLVLPAKRALQCRKATTLATCTPSRGYVGAM